MSWLPCQSLLMPWSGKQDAPSPWSAAVLAQMLTGMGMNANPASAGGGTGARIQAGGWANRDTDRQRVLHG